MELLFSIPVNENKYLILKKISVKLDILKILVRLSKDTQCLREDKYLVLQASLAEIGKMLGGWIRSHENLSSKRLSEEPTSSSD